MFYSTLYKRRADKRISRIHPNYNYQKFIILSFLRRVETQRKIFIKLRLKRKNDYNVTSLKDKEEHGQHH